MQQHGWNLLAMDLFYQTSALRNYSGAHTALQCTDEVVPQGSFGVSVPSNDPIAVDLEYAQGSEPLGHAHHETNGGIMADKQQQCDPVPRFSIVSEPRKGTGKRERDRNWTDDATSILVECKRRAFHEKGSPFRKQRSTATNWEAIATEMRNNPGTGASEFKTGDQCRLRWDTLVKSHRIIKARCVETKKRYEEISDLKLATTLNKGWYEVIDTISRKPKSQKRDNLSPSVGDIVNLEGRLENVPLPPVSSRIAPTDPVSHPLLGEGTLSVSSWDPPPSSPRAQVWPERPELGNSSPKQIAIPGFSSLGSQLRSTLADLILGRRFLRHRWILEFFPEDKRLSLSCRWLSIVQNRRCSEIYDDVSMLVKMELVHVSASGGGLRIDQSRFRVFDKFLKKVIRKNPVYDTHRHFREFDDTKFLSAEEPSMAQEIRVLKLDRCERLERVNLRGLRKLRALFILGCPVLVEVTGWKFLRELRWLEIDDCKLYLDYPDLPNLSSLREFRFVRETTSDCLLRNGLDISQCVRLRRLEILADQLLVGSGDLSSLKCLEILSFGGCGALSTIAGFSGLHALTNLNLAVCEALRSLPDVGHMKELVCIDINGSGLEQIPGVEKLVSLKTLDCSFSNLKFLPDLHHLRELRKVLLENTPLIEDDPSSFYFDRAEVLYNCEEIRPIDVTDISDTEYNLPDSSDDED